ncbi:MAG: DUF1365 domain-containing protein [Usitatibacter sp.]
MSKLQSALYVGTLRHRRIAPAHHAFEYPLAMAWIDLAELDQVFRDRWFWSARRPALAWLRRSDYLGDPAVPLDTAVRDRVESALGRRPQGPVRLLTHLRTFGHSFNPVTFYYCFAGDGASLEAIVAEITNTPWKERHAYVLDAAAGVRRSLRFRFPKAFHVSPFMPMELEYDWRFSQPERRLVVHMTNLQSGVRFFDATLRLRRREIDGVSLAGALARFPFASLRVLAGIYWQALRLFLKGTPVHDHPAPVAGRPS